MGGGERVNRLFSEMPQLSGGRITIKRITMNELSGLTELVASERVYRMLPTFLYEKSRADTAEVIETLYTECIEESLILGVFAAGEFCGLTELYGCDEEQGKINIGFRLLERSWGRGIASELLELVTGYLLGSTGINTVCASAMTKNAASERVLEKNGFVLVSRGAEDWGYPEPTLADKWVKTRKR